MFKSISKKTVKFIYKTFRKKCFQEHLSENYRFHNKIPEIISKSSYAKIIIKNFSEILFRNITPK